MALDAVDKTALDLINGVDCAGGCASATDIADAIRAAIAAEREACAAICDECNRQDESDNGVAMTGAANIAAERIRARM